MYVTTIDFNHVLVLTEHFVSIVVLSSYTSCIEVPWPHAWCILLVFQEVTHACPMGSCWGSFRGSLVGNHSCIPSWSNILFPIIPPSQIKGDSVVVMMSPSLNCSSSFSICLQGCFGGQVGIFIIDLALLINSMVYQPGRLFGYYMHVCCSSTGMYFIATLLMTFFYLSSHACVQA